MSAVVARFWGRGLGAAAGRGLPRGAALLTLILTAAVALWAAAGTPSLFGQSMIDYDTDDDGLIDVTNFAQFNAMRWDQDGNGDNTSVPYNREGYRGGTGAFPNPMPWMGCPSNTCRGYELLNDIVAPATTATRNILTMPFWRTTLEGNGHSVTGLKIYQTRPLDQYASGRAGLFGQVYPQGRIRNLRLINPDITTAHSTNAGGIAAETDTGSVISNVSVEGGSVTLGHSGALNAGGLVGSHQGQIIASWSTAEVGTTGTVSFPKVGGLVGTIPEHTASATIVASYAAGAVTGSGEHYLNSGGIVGYYKTASSTIQADIIDSYCSAATGRTNVATRGTFGSPLVNLGGSCLSASAMQTPTDYTGIYANWNVDITADGIPDNPWYFGATSTYPTLSRWRTAGPTVDYDVDNDGYIDVSNLHQLDALRYDSNGDGNPNSAAVTAAYELGFRDRETTTTGRMGCPSSGCIGYELLADLVIPAAGTPYTQWAPIDGFNTVLLGRGHTIGGVRVNVNNGDAGLFSALGGSARVEELGLINPSVTLGATTTVKSVGALAGFLPAGARIGASYVSGGSVTVNNSSSYAGGLVGFSRGPIRASYSSAAVTAAGNTSTAGGLVGGMSHSGAIIASYAYGAVTSTAPGGAAGGLVGRESGSATALTDSYCDTTAGGLADCIGAQTGGDTLAAPGYATADLQAPVNYTGIYAAWNIDLDADTFRDNPWWFGGATDYPRPQYLRPAGGPVDYDANDNGLIDIGNLDQLHAMSHDLNGDGVPDAAGRAADYALGFPDRITATSTRMGCPAGSCTGYELMTSLAFPASGSPYNPWTPIGNFAATFDGGGHTLSGARIEVSSGGAGFLAYLGANAVVRDLGLVNFNVTSTVTSPQSSGILVGFVPATAALDNVYVEGGSIVITDGGSQGNVGGLAGHLRGTLRAGYSTAAVSVTGGTETNRHAGGLVGRRLGGTIIASYAAGPVTSTAAVNIGGLVGQSDGGGGAITNSYCDTEAGGLADCIGSQSGAAVTAAGYTTAQMQEPTGYLGFGGIYEHWNLDYDGDGAPEYPWDFGSSSEYPTLYNPTDRAAQVPSAADYDANDNNLIDVRTLAQLYALRWDANGDGEPTTAGATAYSTAFGGRTTSTPGRMGCAAACAGYELSASLTFPAATGTAFNPWTPIGGPFNQVLDGRGNTLTGLRVAAAAGHAGLFAELGGSGVIRDLGLISPEVSVITNNTRRVGALAGSAASGSRIDNVYVSGGTVTVSVNGVDGGGLVGHGLGAIRGSYSTARVESTGSTANLSLGGLVGQLRGSITASYAAGAMAPSPTSTTVDGGGLVGSANGNATVVAHSYCDAEAGGQSDCIGGFYNNAAVVAPALSTAALQAPTGYTGIYVPWNLDLDGDDAADHPWNFGTSGDYPTPNTPAQRAAVPTPAATDYDANNNNLIDISHVDQLNALRWDADGDGDPDIATSTPFYNTIFPGRTATTTGRMGCPATCIGYELTADLTYPAATGSGYIPYWLPAAGNYNAVFDGRGHTLTGINIYVPRISSAGGLFAWLGGSSTVRDLGFINGTLVSESLNSQNNGLLAGNLRAGGVVTAVYAEGGSVTIGQPGSAGGGLVGSLRGTLRAAWSTAAVNATGTDPRLDIGGLIGARVRGRLIASFAAGSVTSTTGSPVNSIGGLMGGSYWAEGAVTDSYCDTEASGQSDCIGYIAPGSLAVSAPGYTTAQLQGPTDYPGTIYALWNLDLDSDFFPDYPWNFGGSSDYPRLNTPAQRIAAAPETTDYDVNDNGLIDISSLAHLDAMRYDANGDGVPEAATTTYNAAFSGRSGAALTRMGCPMGNCTGYELRMSLTFPAETSSPYTPWTPIASYAGTFDGAGYTLTDLQIETGSGSTGLFGVLSAGGLIKDVGLLNPAVTSTGATENTGALVGSILPTANVDTSYVSGGSVSIAGDSAIAGGLAGLHRGRIRASYSTAAVAPSGAPANARIGGLVGYSWQGETIGSYAAGPVTASTGAGAEAGGLVGRSDGATDTITDSVCDTAASGQANCVGALENSSTAAATGYVTAALQNPTGYEGPFAHWNLDLDASGRPDYLWNFGTISQYPTLHTPTARPPLPGPMDYDANDNDLIDIGSIAQLNAIRWDVDGDGAPDSAGVRPGYDTAFPGRTTTTTGRMGCPNTCAGYELTRSLTFPSETSSSYNPWTPPVASFNTVFDGNGHTLSGLNVVGSFNVGLFGVVGAPGVIRDVGLISPSVTAEIPGRFANPAGALAAWNYGLIQSSYVQGGRVTVKLAATGTITGAPAAGGLVGRNSGDIKASYAAAVAVSNTGTLAMGANIGGLAGEHWNGNIVASYAAPGELTGTSSMAMSTRVGGLVGNVTGDVRTIVNSYCDTTTTTDCVAGVPPATFPPYTDPGQTSAALQTPTGYTGIYRNWNLDLDGDHHLDYPWNFGAATSYPVPNTASQRAAAVPARTDYDRNNNNLIDISSIAQLDVMRYDPDGDGNPTPAGAAAYGTAFAGRNPGLTNRMGCPNTCAGYELTMSLTFPASTDSSYNPWTPLGAYAAEFDGAGYTLSDLRIETGSGDAGLFGRLSSGGLIRDLGLLNPAVTSTALSASVGALVGRVDAGGDIDTSYVSGGRVAVTGATPRAGGLVGQNQGRIRAGYATAAVQTVGDPVGVRIGGLVGYGLGGEIVASYAAGLVTPGSGGSANAGGLLGISDGGGDTVTDSVCDITVSEQMNCIGDTINGSTAAAQGYLTAALQSPTDYAGGIYVNWNLDLDGNYAPDYPWRFGGSGDYPMLNTPMQRADAAPPPVDYDHNDNGLIDIRSIAQLHAIRWDANGDGVPESNPAVYATIFEGRITATSTRMGCPAGNCTGYELTMSLSFPSATTSPYNPWTPIAGYAATFDGAGHTLSGLRIETASGDTGLIGSLNSGGLIRDLGLLDPAVTSTGAQNTGALVGQISAGGNVDTSYVSGGRVAASGNNAQAGGLAGQNSGRIRASYATAAVSADGNPTGLRLGGLVGYGFGGQIVASYAAGPVTPGTGGGGAAAAGGLVGRSDGATDFVTNSFCDTAVTTQADCVGVAAGGSTAAAAAYTTAQLRQPTGYHFPYINWNLDLNGDGVLDYPWNFGVANGYPRLNTPAQREQLIPAPTDYDTDDDNLIDISSIEQLNAMRWDLNNGDGDPETANFNAYGTAFPGRATSTPGRMGCRDVCAGYELVEDLTFPAETSSPYNPWTPIGGFMDTVLDGKGHTLTNLRVEIDGFAGLFHQIGGVGRVRNLGLINPNVTSTAVIGRAAGALAGDADSGSEVEYSYVHGGRIATTGGGGGNTAWVGGLLGVSRGTIRASYSGAAVAASQNSGVRMGGLVGSLDGGLLDSFAYGPVVSTAAQNTRGGLIGYAAASASTSNSYCDLDTGLQSRCIGGASVSFAGGVNAVAGQTTEELQTPTGYEGIYAGWDQDLDNDPATDDDPVWDFGSASEYPALYHERRTPPDSPPPGGPRFAQPPQETPYNPASDHPEVYENPRHEMAASCQVQRNADGEPVGSLITFDLGSYRGQVILHLAQWNGEYFTSYESLGIAMPTFERDGQTATVRVTTNPANTRFLLDSVSPTTNLVLGYADCHTDDATGVLATPGAAAATPAETPATSTPEMPAETAETSTPPTPPAPKVYVNERYEMTASCDVRNNADGEPESSLITFDLGRYEGTVLLSISLWNGEYYASLESHGLTAPTLERNGQTATVLVTTNPAETRFLLDGTPNGLRMNLLLGYADCHTAGE